MTVRMGYDLVITSPAGSEQGDAAVRFRGRNRTIFGGNGRVHSNSQQTILEKYAQENGFRNTRVFIDDGWSGTNFAGPAFTEIMEQAEKGLIVTLIVKDYCAIIGLNQKGLENQGLLA